MYRKPLQNALRCFIAFLVVTISLVEPTSAFSQEQAQDSVWPFPLWTSECVTCAKPPLNGSLVSIDVDPNGFPHIAYNAATGLMYTFQDADGWHTEAVSDACSLNRDMFLEIGADGKKHILYECNSVGVYYAYRDDAGWHSAHIFDNTDFVWNLLGAQWVEVNSFVLDSGGRPHGTLAAVFNQVTHYIYHIYLTNLGWQQEVVGPGEDGALALGPGDAPHVARAYHIWDHNRTPIDSYLEYSYRDDLGWHSEVLAHPPTGLDTAIAVDSAGWPRIINDGGALPGNYFRKEAAGWTQEVAIVAGDPILRLDAEDRPTVGSYNMYVTWFSIRLPDGWFSIPFDRKDFYFSDASMALDANGRAHIAYREFSTNHVTYLRPYTGPVYPVYLPAVVQ